MLRIPKQSYTEEFKREAVKLVEGGIKPAEVARQLGISEQTLGNWRKANAAGKERIRKLMQMHGMRARHKRRYKAMTDSKHSFQVAPNVRNRRFRTARPDQIRCGRLISPTYRQEKAGYIWLW